MENSFSMGGLIPLWILGAPFLAAIFGLLTMPKRSHNNARDARGDRASRASPSNMPSTGLSAQRV